MWEKMDKDVRSISTMDMDLKRWFEKSETRLRRTSKSKIFDTRVTRALTTVPRNCRQLGIIQAEIIIKNLRIDMKGIYPVIMQK